MNQSENEDAYIARVLGMSPEELRAHAEAEGVEAPPAFDLAASLRNLRFRLDAALAYHVEHSNREEMAWLSEGVIAIGAALAQPALVPGAGTANTPKADEVRQDRQNGRSGAEATPELPQNPRQFPHPHPSRDEEMREEIVSVIKDIAKAKRWGRCNSECHDYADAILPLIQAHLDAVTRERDEFAALVNEYASERAPEAVETIAADRDHWWKAANRAETALTTARADQERLKAEGQAARDALMRQASELGADLEGREAEVRTVIAAFLNSRAPDFVSIDIADRARALLPKETTHGA